MTRRRRPLRRVFAWLAGLLAAGVLVLLALFVHGLGWGNFERLVLRRGIGFDAVPPALPDFAGRPAILIFAKTNGYRDDAQIAAANAALAQIARANGWASFVTENGAVFDPKLLLRFRTVVWNSVSGNVLTTAQRAALRGWIERGGGFVGLHGSGGDPSYDWGWYADTLIGARFIGHTMGPQFQRATLIVEDRDHPATRHLGPTWTRTDEWYSFANNPRAKGYRILVRIDERSYRPSERFLPFGHGIDLRMGADHPMVWTHDVGRGRAFYSALGHQAGSYAEPAQRRMIAGAIAWAGRLPPGR